MEYVYDLSIRAYFQTSSCGQGLGMTDVPCGHMAILIWQLPIPSSTIFFLFWETQHGKRHQNFLVISRVRVYDRTHILALSQCGRRLTCIDMDRHVSHSFSGLSNRTSLGHTSLIFPSLFLTLFVSPMLNSLILESTPVYHSSGRPSQCQHFNGCRTNIHLFSNHTFVCPLQDVCH